MSRMALRVASALLATAFAAAAAAEGEAVRARLQLGTMALDSDFDLSLLADEIESFQVEIANTLGVDADRVLAKFSSTESRRLQAGTTDIELMYVVACEQVRSPCTRVLVYGIGPHDKLKLSYYIKRILKRVFPCYY